MKGEYKKIKHTTKSRGRDPPKDKKHKNQPQKLRQRSLQIPLKIHETPPRNHHRADSHKRQKNPIPKQVGGTVRKLQHFFFKS